MKERVFCRGNVVRHPDGGLFIVIDGDANILMPINTTNCTWHPPNKDRYGESWVYNEDTGEEELQRKLEMHSIHKYTCVARNIEEFIVGRFKKVMFDD